MDNDYCIGIKVESKEDVLKLRSTWVNEFVKDDSPDIFPGLIYLSMTKTEFDFIATLEFRTKLKPLIEDGLMVCLFKE